MILVRAVISVRMVISVRVVISVRMVILLMVGWVWMRGIVRGEWVRVVEV